LRSGAEFFYSPQQLGFLQVELMHIRAGVDLDFEGPVYYFTYPASLVELGRECLVPRVDDGGAFFEPWGVGLKKPAAAISYAAGGLFGRFLPCQGSFEVLIAFEFLAAIFHLAYLCILPGS